MKDSIGKITNILALVLIIVSVALVLWMYLGGSEGTIDVGGESLNVPSATNPLLFWSYALLIATVAITVIFAIYKFAKNIAANPKSAVRTLVPLIIFALIFVVAWNVGSGERMTIIGYEGTQNEGFWAQLSDMFIYVIYTLLVAIIVTILGSRVYVKLK